MKNTELNSGIRLILLFCGLMLIPVLFKPIWKIELSAPQYPEGLMMTISANGLGGDVDIINGLNHYIGMKTLHNEDFWEFKALPYIIAGFVLFFLTVAITGKRKAMRLLLGCLVLFGALAMYDFWKWEYDYGHNLDPNAAIIVPDMSYQPPLIGFKQLLNFGAYSVPAIGGWLFVSSGLLLLFCILLDYSRLRKGLKLRAGALAALMSICVLLTSGCSSGPEPIRIGSDNCHFCKMTISDNKFGAEVITMKGKIFKYDELHCLTAEIAAKGIDRAIIREIYLTDYAPPHGLILGQKGFYLKSDKIKGPMGGNVASFSTEQALKASKDLLGGEELSWDQLIPQK